MKRITAEQVVEAYKKTGLTPIQDHWFAKTSSSPCGCGLTAVAMAKGLTEVYRLDISLPVRIRNTLAIPYPYMDGFSTGFDGDELVEREAYESDEDWELYQLGHDDGMSAWEAVDQHFDKTINLGGIWV